MNLEDYRTLFMAMSLVLILVAALPGLSVTVPFLKDRKNLSELWILGPKHMAEGYPFNIKVGQTQGPVYVGVRNRMGCLQYYSIHVKLRNRSHSLPNVKTSEPSLLLPLYEFRFFSADGEKWEQPFHFAIEDVSLRDDSASIVNISINDIIIPANCAARFDSTKNGFFYQLFYELWHYNTASQRFRFHNRFVGIWLNMTI